MNPERLGILAREFERNINGEVDLEYSWEALRQKLTRSGNMNYCIGSYIRVDTVLEKLLANAASQSTFSGEVPSKPSISHLENVFSFIQSPNILALSFPQSNLHIDTEFLMKVEHNTTSIF